MIVYLEVFWTSLQSLYRLDEVRLAYGGYSLGGLAAVYSLFSFDKVSCVFSICGSFWYPDFVAYCKEENVKNLDCLLYLQNGQTEGAHHTNRLAQAPVYAEQIHTSLQKCYPNGQFVFDTYGHHEQVAERFLAFSSWLAQKWKINKDLSLAFAKGLLYLFNQGFSLFLSGFHTKLAMKLKMIVKIARIMARMRAGMRINHQSGFGFLSLCHCFVSSSKR